MRSRGSDTTGSPAPDGGQIRHRNPILRHGFAQVPRPILKARGLSDKAKLVYWLLLDYSWQGESCYPGQQRMTDDLSTSLASITRSLRELRAYGLITWERRGNQQTNIYWIEDFSNNPRLSFGRTTVGDSSPVTNPRKLLQSITDISPVTNPDCSPAITPDSSPVMSKEYSGERYTEERDPEKKYENTPNLANSRQTDPRDALRASLVEIGADLGKAATSDATLGRLMRAFQRWGHGDVAAFVGQMRDARDRVMREDVGRPGTRRAGRPRSITSRWLDALEEQLVPARDQPVSSEGSTGSGVSAIYDRNGLASRVADDGDAAVGDSLTPRLEVSTNQVWAAALDDLREACTRTTFETWLKSAKLIRLVGDVAVIGAPSTFACDWLAGHLRDDIARALAAILGRRVTLRFEVITR